MVNLGSAIAQGATIAIVIKAVDEFSSTFKKASTGADLLKNSFKVGAAAMVAAGAAIAGLGVATIKAAGDFEQTQIAFETMLGSAEEAKVFLEDLSNFAKTTPFTLQGVEGAARQLMAVGFEAEEVLPTLKSVGDVASGLGLGQEGLQRLILNLGQVRNQGKLTGRELRDFAVAGVPLLDELSKQLGVSTTQIQEMVSAGEISTEMVMKAFRDMTSEGGRFADLMAKQATTVEGRFSNLQDTLSILAREVGAALLPIVKELADALLNDVLPAIEPLIPPFTELLVKFLEMARGILPRLTPLLVRLAEIFLDLFDALFPILEPLMDLGFIIFEALLDVLEPLIPSIKILAEVIGDVLKAAMPLLIPLTELIALFLQAGGEVLLDVLIPALKLLAIVLEPIAFVLGVVVDLVKQAIEFMVDLGKAIRRSAIGKLGDLLGIDFGVGTKKKGGGLTLVDDAIIKPNGEIIKTNPKDTIIATQTPGGMGGIVVNIGTVQGLSAREISMAIQKELNTLVRR